jgi:hypothetical protein
LLLAESRATSYGQYFLLLSQAPEKNTFLIHVRKNPCLEVHLRGIAPIDAPKLRRFPGNIILPLVAIDPVIGFQSVLSDFRLGLQDRTRVQTLSLFSVLLGNLELMKKFDTSLKDALKEIPSESRAQEKGRIFLSVLEEVALAGISGGRPFETSEVSGLSTTCDWSAEPFDVSQRLF